MYKFITIKEAAKLSQKSESYIYRWAKKLPENQVKNGRPFMVSKNAFLIHFKTNLNLLNLVQKEVQKEVQIEGVKKLLKPLNINNLGKVQKNKKVQVEVQKQVQIKKTI